MGWHYAILKDDSGYWVCEDYGNGLRTEQVEPFGETVEELIQDLERMLEDVKREAARISLVDREPDEFM